tara:strand:+ start:343 stop:1173 length:831 start_codon:yes stop_codon:yes gene_type:complete
MIIWLASYPKSGNTWIRLFLDSLFISSNKFNINQNFIKQFPLRSNFHGLTKDVNNQEEFAKYCIPAQKKINLDRKIRIFKTHNAFWNWNKGEFSFTNEDQTLGVIHIVRDPRNVVTSVLNYFNKKNYSDAINFMKTNRVIGGDENEQGLPTIIGSWSSHYKSWRKFKKNNLLIKYEDLLSKPEEKFFRIINFLNNIGNFKFNDDNVLKAIENCKFDNLSNQEDIHGFASNSDTNKKLNKKFFNLGPKNKWEDILDKKTRLEIESLFNNEMVDMGYL